ncbi:sulfatase [Candidatus Poribacteria bacterium]|nr:sulfatase [Candidatus Poribacteria bacterium]MBP95572.1 sulfatase [Candidatus Poribacteria bacterium]
MLPIKDYLHNETRRQFFGKSALGLGTAALSTLMGPSISESIAGEPSKSILKSPHNPPKAKRAIYLFMSGAPSQLDLFDYKPEMVDWFDKELPESVRQGQRLTTMTSGQSRFPIAPSVYKFKKYDNGTDGAWVSELLPYHSTMVSDLAIIKTVHTEAINHDPAITYICTGDQLPGKPSLGSWLSYGLGSDNEDLPAFVVMNATWTGRKSAQALYNRLWGSGFLPSQHQGVLLRSSGDPVLFLSNPDGVKPQTRKEMLTALNQLNRKNYQEVGDPEIHARISQYEMAFRMQTSVPELTDFSSEPDYILDMYGPDVHKPGTFAYCCLMARRLAERGVRFSQIFHRGWDQHGNVTGDLPNQARDIDQPATALIQDLKQRGMLDDTLVVWGGEFGRTIYCQGSLTRKNYGRDHHPKCYTVWMAGAGVKPGIVYGETDDFSYNIVRDPVHIHQLNATILDQLGVDHRLLSVKFQGLDHRLTGVEEAKVIDDILA